MNIAAILIFLSVVGLLAYKLYKSHLNSKNKTEEVKNQQVNPSEQVPGLEYDTTEVDPTKR